MGVSIVITSGKGGTGKTTVAASLASCLSALGKTVICVDADIGARNLDIALGLSGGISGSLDLSDALRMPDEPGAALTAHPDLPGLSLISAPLTRRVSELDTRAFAPLIRALSARADFVLVDCCAGLEDGFFMSVNACERAVIVSTADASSLRVAARCAQLTGKEKRPRLIVNRVNPKLIVGRNAPEIDDIMDATGLPLLGLVPEDEMVSAAANRGVPLTLAGGTGAAAAILRIARRLLGEDVPIGRMKRWQVNG
ncbi:MAG: P-loop NTPase [Oscillospiraceae bacterium]|jgi:septum site-determining protein MinD|nr:P-loop NTPase [Oscillospiraceae bacterium]